MKILMYLSGLGQSVDLRVVAAGGSNWSAANLNYAGFLRASLVALRLP
jgi:hypothetical protein